MKLPHNPNLKEHAKELRKANNLSEALLWSELKNGKLDGLKFNRQKNIGRYIVDFYCAEKKLVIEIDGGSHDGKEDYDTERDRHLKGLGLTVMHLLDVEVRKQMDAVILHISQIAAEL